jgi:hypothetical protein
LFPFPDISTRRGLACHTDATCARALPVLSWAWGLLSPAGQSTVKVVVSGEAITEAANESSRVIKQVVGDLCAKKTTAQVAAEASALATAKVS